MRYVKAETLGTLFVVSLMGLAGRVAMGGAVYPDPPDGWTYIFKGDAASANLDGTWNHDNGSDAWDGSGIGTGQPGGVSTLVEDNVDFVRVQDALTSGSGADNRKIYFTHELVNNDKLPQSVADEILSVGGITLSFRVRLATTPPLDNLNGTTAWPPGGDGYGTHDDGKSNLGVHQEAGGPKTISFALSLATDAQSGYITGYMAGRDGLIINSLNGASPSGNVDATDIDPGTANVLELDPTQWHEFWITIEPDTGGGGTHKVTIWMDGSLDASEFHVTAGTGSDGSYSYIAMGCGSTVQAGAFDVDFFAYKPGLYEPSGGAINNAPSVEAGDDQTKWLRSSSVTVQLDGDVSDDGMGDPNGYLAMEWRWVGGTGEGPILFRPANDIADPCVTIFDFGTYEFQLAATDGEKTGIDTVTITVNEGLKGDLFADDRVDWRDFAIFTEMWLNEAGSEADLVGSDGVNVIDYAVLATNWWSQVSSYSALVEISEFMAENRDTLLTIYEPGGEQHSPDWIEIHNSDDVNSIDLSGWYLTDDKDEPNKWRFPDGFTIGGGGYRVVLASGLGEGGSPFIDPYGYYHTTFQLDKGGDYLALTAPDSRTVVREFADYEYDDDKFGFPPQEEDYSYGILGGVKRYFSTPTPGAENRGAFEGFVADTGFDHDRGFYYADFFVEITTATPGATIRYTTDGSAPTDSRGQVYDSEHPIHITTTTTLRAAAFKVGWMPTNIDTHTYIFPNDVLGQATNPATGAQVVPAGYPASWGSITGDYQVDPEIVNHSNPSDRLTADDMRAVPTFSLVMDREDLFGSRQIYLSGDSQERLCSIELIYPDGSTGFQENGTVQIQGGSSTSRWKSKKLSMRYKFKEFMTNGTPTGGTRKLDHQLYPDAPIDQYDNIIFDGVLNNSWSHGQSSSQRDNCMFIQDQYVGDLHNAMGGDSPRGLFAHLYLNGLYWGMYYVHDRPDHAWAEEMFGGDKEEYHALKHNKVVINNGNGKSAVSSYNAILAAATAAGSDPANLAKWEAVRQKLDVDNFISYILAHWFPGTDDWCSETSAKNIYYTCRDGSEGRWRFHTWDAEHTMKFGTTGFGVSPHGLHTKLSNHVEYKMRFADLAHRFFFNDGVLSGLGPYNMYKARMTEIDRAIVGESARWGDAWDSTPRTRQQWLNVQTNKLSQLNGRPVFILDRLKSAGLYPSLAAPVFSPHGGWDLNGFTLTMTAPATVYYTLDGADPRLPGGAVDTAHTVTYSGAVSLTASTHVKARAKTGSTWSALNEAVFAVGPIIENLRITEIMYNPQATGDPLDPNKEFIELRNIGDAAINLNLVRFTEGIQFTFPQWQLEPNEFILVVRDIDAFNSEYPGLSGAVAGEYAGNLDNASERIRLEDALCRTVHDFEYKDGWFKVTDGGGFSLTIRDAHHTDPCDWGLKDSWGAGTYRGGSPGEDDTGPKVGDIVINEILAHSDIEPYDWVELHNPTGRAIDIGGWWLSDNGSSEPNLMKYQIPENMMIGAGQCRVFTEAQFGNASDPDCRKPFALSENGETLYLSSGIPGELTLTGFREQREFRASDPDVSFALYAKSSVAAAAGDPTDFVASSVSSKGFPNTYPPMIGPVVIAEIMYNPANPADPELEYIKLVNISGSTVTLQRYYPDEGIYVQWKFTDGVRYTFPLNTAIAAGDYVYVVYDLAEFSAAYPGVPAGKIFGPFENDDGGQRTKLRNSGDDLELSKPGDNDLGTGQRFYILVDRINYSDGTHPKTGYIDPWPIGADGAGLALKRKELQQFGNDPNNWQASIPTPAALNP